MASIGEELRRERELRGISLKEIASSTKISLRLLRALEEDRLDILPGKFFTKVIIKSYAKYIGLEEDYALNKYYEDSIYKDQAQETVQRKKGGPLVIPKDIKKLTHFLLLTLLLLLFFFVIYFIFPKKEAAPPPRQSPPSILPKKEALPSPPEAELPPQEKGLKLEITFLDKTWIQVYADSKIQVDGIKYPGEKVEIKALNELILHLGNAGGISYTINNHKGKKLGSSGAVVKNIRITLENFTEFLAQEEKTAEKS